MAVDNDHARSGHTRQGSTQASHVWARQLNSQANRTEKETRTAGCLRLHPLEDVVAPRPTAGGAYDLETC